MPFTSQGTGNKEEGIPEETRERCNPPCDLLPLPGWFLPFTLGIHQRINLFSTSGSHDLTFWRYLYQRHDPRALPAPGYLYFRKINFFFNYLYSCVSVNGYVHVSAGALG